MVKVGFGKDEQGRALHLCIFLTIITASAKLLHKIIQGVDHEKDDWFGNAAFARIVISGC